MTAPSHALQIWIVEDTIRILYPDGQLIAIPSLEPSRLVSILRSQVPRQPPDRFLGWRDHFVEQFGTAPEKEEYKAAKDRGREVRQKEQDRLAREKRARMKRIEKRDQEKRAQEILDIVGL